MEQLCYETLEKAGYTGYLLKNAPERVLQFGEGNFLRAFADYWFDMANEKAGWNGKCVLVQPIAQGLTQLINRQEGLYTLENPSVGMILCKNADTDVVEYSLSRSLSQTMIAEYKTKLIDKSILQRKLAELYDIAEEEVKNSQQD